MSQIMTFEEIKQNYDGEWVLMVLNIVKGIMLGGNHEF